MNTKIPDDQFLLRWMNGELNEQEEKEWKASEGYRQWQRIQVALKRRALPGMEKEKAYRELEQKLPAPEAKVRNLQARWAIGIAAALVLAVSFFFLFAKADTWEVPMAEQESVELPDGSTALLNAGTELSYRKSFFNGSRQIQLEGEAFFSVEPGAPFTVKTPEGSVLVLGTRFNVRGREGQFEVYCTEGKVEVSYKGQAFTLEAGQGIHPAAQAAIYQHDQQSARWTAGESHFRDTALPLVFDELERQYDIQVQHPALSGRRYTGRFPHDDLESALAIICGAMNLSFTLVSEDQVVIEVQ
jgi:ferric-dicitrate binding protein FerR (iron transport regulator)